MLVGYARVSTADQNLDLQRDALGQAECGKTFTDVISGAQAERPGPTAPTGYGRPTTACWTSSSCARAVPRLGPG